MNHQTSLVFLLVFLGHTGAEKGLNLNVSSQLDGYFPFKLDSKLNQTCEIKNKKYGEMLFASNQKQNLLKLNVT
jgi:hypothetical protein